MSEGLASEVASLYRDGETAETIGKSAVSPEAIACLADSGSPAMRAGVSLNPATGRDTLKALSSKGVLEAAERIARIDQWVADASAGDSAVFSEALESFDVTALGEMFDTSPEVAARAIVRASEAKLTALKTLAPSLHARLLVLWAQDGTIPISRYIATNLASDPERTELLLAGFTAQELARRCTQGARDVLAELGLVNPSTPASAAGVPLDQMALVMSPGELSGAYVGSLSPVSEELAARILTSAPPSLVLNYLLGATLRKPAKDDALRLVLEADSDKRDAWASDLTARAVDPELLASTPSGAAIALLASGETVAKLPVSAVAELSEVIENRIGHSAAAWEFLFVLSEEWEGTLAGLLDTSAAMEPSEN